MIIQLKLSKDDHKIDSKNHPYTSSSKFLITKFIYRERNLVIGCYNMTKGNHSVNQASLSLSLSHTHTHTHPNKQKQTPQKKIERKGSNVYKNVSMLLLCIQLLFLGKPHLSHFYHVFSHYHVQMEFVSMQQKACTHNLRQTKKNRYKE